MLEPIRDFISQPAFLIVWGASVAIAIGVLVWDLATKNPAIKGLMRVVWLLTVAYSGLLGLAIYFYSGRAQIPEDDLFRRALRSVSHCYSGCGAGEILGVSLAVGVLALPTAGVAAVTFTFAYVFGLALTVGPLVQDRVPFRTAMKDGVVSETASIVVMELVAIGVDLALARDAGMDEPLFWSSLAVSLTLGLIAATPVNAWLIARGVKAGMHDPREMAAHAA